MSPATGRRLLCSPTVTTPGITAPSATRCSSAKGCAWWRLSVLCPTGGLRRVSAAAFSRGHWRSGANRIWPVRRSGGFAVGRVVGLAQAVDPMPRSGRLVVGITLCFCRRSDGAVGRGAAGGTRRRRRGGRRRRRDSSGPSLPRTGDGRAFVLRRRLRSQPRPAAGWGGACGTANCPASFHAASAAERGTHPRGCRGGRIAGGEIRRVAAPPTGRRTGPQVLDGPVSSGYCSTRRNDSVLAAVAADRAVWSSLVDGDGDITGLGRGGEDGCQVGWHIRAQQRHVVGRGGAQRRLGGLLAIEMADDARGSKATTTSDWGSSMARATSSTSCDSDCRTNGRSRRFAIRAMLSSLKASASSSARTVTTAAGPMVVISGCAITGPAP